MRSSGTLPGADEAAQLQRAAEARRLVDEAFSVVPAVLPSPAPELGHALSKILRIDGVLPDGALAEAAGSLSSAMRLISRLRHANPKVVLAGLAVGLAAGPVGGALAAGTAGLVAGASLMSVLGTLGAVALGRVLSTRLFGVDSFDPAVLAITLVGLGAAALVASWLPARRASRVDPMIALREE